MGPFEIHVFVCTTGGTCPHQGSGAVHAYREEAETIFTEHILGGRPVERLLYRPPKPGGHKLARNKDGKPVERCTLCRGGQATTYARESA